jgi:hypothetical protein
VTGVQARDRPAFRSELGIDDRHGVQSEPTEVAVALRGFVGDDGQEWQVWDTRPTIESSNAIHLASDTVGEVPRISKKREGGWLTFTAGNDRRRLSPIPDDWETADETSLRAMAAAADRVAG